uniref:Uncharacterized protein n=1 Tax=Rhizophora mucronata TaxID=61149 RepID=A0A2P2PB26_RHIMU
MTIGMGWPLYPIHHVNRFLIAFCHIKHHLRVK